MWGSVPLSPSSVRSPAVTAAGTEQGAKGEHFLPRAKEGNNGIPARQVGDESGAGSKKTVDGPGNGASAGNDPETVPPGVARRQVQ